jgi:hypothetical protein
VLLMAPTVKFAAVAVAFVPFVGCGAGDWRPQVRCHPDAEISGRVIEVGRDDHGLVGVFCSVVEDFPPSVVLDARPGWSDPLVFELPV